MSGRGDNNKNRSAGRRSSTQGNQPFIPKQAHHKSNRSRNHIGGRASVKTERSFEWNDERSNGRAVGGERPYSSDARKINLVVDSVPYMVDISPFTFNDEQRYYVRINGGPEHIFTWDSEINALRAIDDEASMLPSSLEEEISRRLQLKPR